MPIILRRARPADSTRRAKPLAVIAAVLTLGISITVSAAPPPGTDRDSPLAKWFRDLMRPDTNTSCCDTSDCRNVESRLTQDGWEARVGTSWLRVPWNRVLHKDNPTGRAVACHLPSLGIICFVPPPQS
jgi:hypothetical protein